MGGRPIGVTPLPAALFLKNLSDIVLLWEDDWEDAVRGSSALQAGLRRRLLDECAVALGQDTASIFWDLAKFCDTIEEIVGRHFRLSLHHVNSPLNPEGTLWVTRFAPEELVHKPVQYARGLISGRLARVEQILGPLRPVDTLRALWELSELHDPPHFFRWRTLFCRVFFR